MRSSPLAQRRTLTEPLFRRDLVVSKTVLGKVVVAMEQAGIGSGVIERVVRDVIADLIDDTSLDQASQAQRQLAARLLDIRPIDEAEKGYPPQELCGDEHESDTESGTPVYYCTRPVDHVGWHQEDNIKWGPYRKITTP
jgi:hypothetical protein